MEIGTLSRVLHRVCYIQGAADERGYVPVPFLAGHWSGSLLPPIATSILPMGSVLKCDACIAESSPFKVAHLFVLKSRYSTPFPPPPGPVSLLVSVLSAELKGTTPPQTQRDPS